MSPRILIKTAMKKGTKRFLGGLLLFWIGYSQKFSIL
jgi:hypothetical protein